MLKKRERNKMKKRIVQSSYIIEERVHNEFSLVFCFVVELVVLYCFFFVFFFLPFLLFSFVPFWGFLFFFSFICFYDAGFKKSTLRKKSGSGQVHRGRLSFVIPTSDNDSRLFACFRPTIAIYNHPSVGEV